MITISGHGDYTVFIRGDFRGSVGYYGDTSTITVGDKSGGIRVIAQFSLKRTTWRFSVEPIDEGVPMPWAVRVLHEHRYSLGIEIGCPPGTPVRYSGKVLNAKLMKFTTPEGICRVSKDIGIVHPKKRKKVINYEVFKGTTP